MKKTCLSLGVAASILLTGCASYQSNTLSALDPECVREYPEIEGVSIGCKAYSKEDCFTFLDRDVIAKGYQPIQLTFQNNTDNRYVFSIGGVSLPCTNPETVASTVHTNTAGRVIGYSVGGLLFWPLFIPAVVDGIGSSNANKELDKDFYDKAKERLVIHPKGFSKTLLFVPRAQFAPVFDVTLIEEESGKEKTAAVTVVN